MKSKLARSRATASVVSSGGRSRIVAASPRPGVGSFARSGICSSCSISSAWRMRRSKAFKANAAPTPSSEPEQDAEDRVAPWRRSDLAGAVGGADDRGRREQDLERTEVLCLAQELLVRVGAGRACFPELREPALDLARARVRLAVSVSSLYCGERLRVGVRQAGRDVRVAVR